MRVARTRSRPWQDALASGSRPPASTSRTRADDPQGRRGRSGIARCASAVDADQCLGIALAAQHLSRPRCRASSAAPCSTGSTQAEAMSLDDYRAADRASAQVRALYAELARDMRRLREPAAPAAAPLGIDSTGDPLFTVHALAVSASRRSRCRCCRTRVCRSACRSSALPSGDADAFAVAAGWWWLEHADG